MKQDYKLPNIRKMFIPRVGFEMFEADLKGADAQVVAWEAEDEDLKAAFRAGLDIHSKNAEDMLGSAFTRLQGEARARVRKKQKFAVHGTNYGGSPPAIAYAAGWTIHEADQWQKRWFSLHPKIRDWHKKVERQLQTTRKVTNAYGYSIHFFERTDDLLPEALAWVPQSTVAEVCYIGMIQLREAEPKVRLNLQVHDSTVGQYPIVESARMRKLLPTILQSVTPYADPLIIPWDLKYSRKSWGDMEKLAA